MTLLLFLSTQDLLLSLYLSRQNAMESNVPWTPKASSKLATSLRNLRKSLTMFRGYSALLSFIITIGHHEYLPRCHAACCKASKSLHECRREELTSIVSTCSTTSKKVPRDLRIIPATESLRWTWRPTELKHWLSTMRNGGFLYMLLLYSSIHTNSEKQEAMDCEWFWFLRSHQFLNIFWICLDILKSARTCKGWYLWHHHINRSSVDAQRIPRINSCGEPTTLKLQNPSD